MLKIFGSAIVLLVGIYLGNKLCSEQRIKLITIEALIEFTEFIRTSIYTSRMPLMEIYALFDNKSLHERGFIYQLNQHGLKSALCTVSEYISDKSLTTLNSFADNIGGMNTDTQLKLCEETTKLLNEEYKKQENIFSKKERIYKTLPILFATSIIIMMI